MIILVSLLAALIGLLMYVLTGNPKLQEIGRILFGAGILAFLLQIHPGTVGLLPH